MGVRRNPPAMELALYKYSAYPNYIAIFIKINMSRGVGSVSLVQEK
jgi:hypothetical protein